MRLYIFRDIYTGKLYRVRAYSSAEAQDKISKLLNIKRFNLARVKPQEKVRHA